MSEEGKFNVAIIDFGMGNLFSVQQACHIAGLDGEITSHWKVVSKADAVILPGVGAFGTAMQRLRELELIKPLIDVAQSNKPLLGICLGMQLLMTQSHEFGLHAGLDILPGEVVRFISLSKSEQILKVPHTGWSQIYQSEISWNGSLLEGIPEGEYMYFVHSYYVNPGDSSITMSISHYGNTTFCSSIKRRNVFGCQFHPERSGLNGLRIYKNIANSITNTKNDY